MEGIIYKDVTSKRNRHCLVLSFELEVSSMSNIVILILTFYEGVLLKKKLGI